MHLLVLVFSYIRDLHCSLSTAVHWTNMWYVAAPGSSASYCSIGYNQKFFVILALELSQSPHMQVYLSILYKCKNHEIGCRDDTVPKTVETRRHCEED